MSEEQRACRTSGESPELWFADRATPEANRAKRLCMDCPLYWECQTYALEQGIPDGIWGGMDRTDRERTWAGKLGGRPSTFAEVIDDNVRPLLQERRDHENFDKQHDNEMDEAS